MPTLIYVNPLSPVISGLFKMDPKKWLGGIPASGRTIVEAKYPNTSASNVNAHKCMLAIDAALQKFPGTASVPTYVVGHSMGAQGIYKWLREKGPTSSINPATVVFYTTGCPEQKFTGASVLYPAQSPAVYPGITAHTSGCLTPPEHHGGFGVGYGLPTVCPWTVYCIANQHDGWADAPDGNLSVPEIADMWTHSIFCPCKASSGPHGAYTRPITDPTAVTYTDPAQPTVTYVWLPTYPLPNLNSIKWLRFWARMRDEARRSVVEAEYTRPVIIPPPDYAAAPSWIPY